MPVHTIGCQTKFKEAAQSMPTDFKMQNRNMSSYCTNHFSWISKILRQQGNRIKFFTNIKSAANARLEFELDI